MPFMYDAVHNTVRRYETDEDDDDKRAIRDGERVRVPLMMRDSSAPPPGAKMWHHSPIPMRDGGSDRPLDGGDVELISRRELADWDKAQLSARWKGGLQDGDRVRIGDKNLVVSGRNPTNGKIQLSDASTSAQDAETARRNAYVAYDRDIQRSWMNTHDAKAGDRCTTAGRESGRWREREKDGRLVCVPDDKSSKEFALAGPLSDEERVQIKDRMYASYDEQIQNAWRK